MNKHHTVWILFKSIMSDLYGRIVSTDSGIVQKIGKWNIVPSWLHKSLVKSFFFSFVVLFIYVFVCLPLCYLRIWIKNEISLPHSSIWHERMRSTVSKKENVNLDLCWTLNFILTFLIHFQENDGGIFFFLRIPNLDQKKGKLFKKQKRSFNNLRDSWHLICVERHFE